MAKDGVTSLQEISEEDLLSDMLPGIGDDEPGQSQGTPPAGEEPQQQQQQSEPQNKQPAEQVGDDEPEDQGQDDQLESGVDDATGESGGEEEPNETPEDQPETPEQQPTPEAWKNEIDRLQAQNEFLQHQMLSMGQNPRQPMPQPMGQPGQGQGQAQPWQTGAPQQTQQPQPQQQQVDIFAGIESISDDERSILNQRVNQVLATQIGHVQENMWQNMPQAFLQFYDTVRLSESLGEELSDVMTSIQPQQRQMFEQTIGQITTMVRQREPGLQRPELVKKVSNMYRRLNGMPEKQMQSAPPAATQLPGTQQRQTRPPVQNVQKRQRVVPMDRPGARQPAKPATAATTEEEQLRECLPID